MNKKVRNGFFIHSNAIELLLKHTINNDEIGKISQITNYFRNISPVAVGLSKKGFYIFPHTKALFANVANMHDITLVVYACRSRHKHLSAVGIVNSCGTLKANTVFACAVHVVGCIEILYLLLLYACNSIGVQLREHKWIGLSATNTSRSDEMGAFCKMLSLKNIISCFYYSCIVIIYIVYKEPCAYAIISKCATFLRKL